MPSQKKCFQWMSPLMAIVVTMGLAGNLNAQGLNENFDGVTETGGGPFLTGQGQATVDNWDDGIAGEQASASTSGNARFGAASALGSVTGGVGGTGAGVLDVSGLNFNLLDESFETVNGTGGGIFLAGDGMTPDTFNRVFNWDNGIFNEQAFGGTQGGAILIGNMSAEGLPTGGNGSGGGGRVVVENVDITSGIWFAGLEFITNSFPGIGLVNEGFEDTSNFSDDWNPFGNALAATPDLSPPSIVPRTGNALGKLFGAFCGDSGIFQRLCAEPGQTWELSAYVRHNDDDAMAGSNTLIMKIEFLDDTETVLASDEVTVLDASSLTETWHHTGTLQLGPAPDGTVEVRPVFIFIQPFAECLGGAAHIDDVRFEVVSGPSGVDLSKISLTADVKGTANGAAGELLGDFQLRIEDVDGNRLYFQETANGAWQSVGGALSSATEADANGEPASGVFNTNSGSYTVVISFESADSTIGDMNCDGSRNGADVAAFILAALNPEGYGAQFPSCDILNGDLNGDLTTDIGDIAAFVDLLLAPPPSGWGSGGTLDVDNLVLTNTGTKNSDWSAELFWENLTPPDLDISQLSVITDVSGSAIGGEYELRVAAIKISPTGINDDFEAATGVGGDVLIDDASKQDGQTFGFSNDWDTGIEGEGAFAGIFGLVDIAPTGGIFAEATTTGGHAGGGLDGGAGGRIRAEQIFVAGDAGWFAGLDWGGQGLASTDLSQVTLTADIKGTVPPSGGALGLYELRIEDAQGDRLYDQRPATGNWEIGVGGTLDTFMEGPALDGFGDGTFNLDSEFYTVVVSFIEPESTWFTGGILTVDNLFMTPVDVKTEIGHTSYKLVATGGFQFGVGGVLSAADEITFGDFTENFEGATGAPGGTPMPGNDAQDWDSGLLNENAFYGTYGAGVNGAATITACATCGIGGTQAAELDVSVTYGSGPPSGRGWFSGIYFTNVPADLSADLSTIDLTAQIKAIPQPGGSSGTYLLRIEDEDLTARQFTITPDGSGEFELVGGPLSTAAQVQIEPGDNIFNQFQDTYTFTIAAVGEINAEWDLGISLTVDDLFLTGVQFEDGDDYRVSLRFLNPLTTWPNGGTLTVDNLFFGTTP